MIDYMYKNKFKLFLIRLIDFFTFSSKYFIYSLIYLEVKGYVKLLAIQPEITKYGRDGWEFCSMIDKSFDSIVGQDIFIFKKEVGRLEYNFYVKHLKEQTDNLFEKLTDAISSMDSVSKNDINKEESPLNVKKVEKKDNFINTLKNKSKLERVSFINDIFEEDNGDI